MSDLTPDTLLERLDELPAIARSLSRAASVTEFLAGAADAARTTFGFERGIVLTVNGGYLEAAGSAPLTHSASDALRRRASAKPIRIARATTEGEMVHHIEVGTRPRAAATSPLAEHLGLRHYALAALAPESRVLALLVVDREHAAVGAVEEKTLHVFAAALSAGLAQVVLRARVRELSGELRYMSASTQAMAEEVLDAPVAVPSSGRHLPAFARMDAASAVAPDGRDALLNERERQIAALLIEGRSNREIGEQLMLSPATVKEYVARLLRKLNASNRVEAVARLVGLIN